MKKIALLLALVIVASALFACGGDSETATTAADATTAALTTTKAVTTAPATTTAEETPDPQIEIDYGTPNNKAEGKEYHLESIVIPTNIKNLDQEYGILIENTAQSNDSYRYCDGFGYVVYEIDISKMIEPTIDILILQNYLVSIAAYNDPDCYKTVLDYSEEYTGTLTSGGNDRTFTINPYEHGFYKTLYIMIEDTNPSDGWGGTIRNLTINQYVEGAGDDITTTYGG